MQHLSSITFIQIFKNETNFTYFFFEHLVELFDKESLSRLYSNHLVNKFYNKYAKRKVNDFVN